jgi:hypothetical protein
MNTLRLTLISLILCNAYHHIGAEASSPYQQGQIDADRYMHAVKNHESYYNFIPAKYYKVLFLANIDSPEYQNSLFELKQYTNGLRDTLTYDKNILSDRETRLIGMSIELCDIILEAPNHYEMIKQTMIKQGFRPLLSFKVDTRNYYYQKGYKLVKKALELATTYALGKNASMRKMQELSNEARMLAQEFPKEPGFFTLTPAQYQALTKKVVPVLAGAEQALREYSPVKSLKGNKSKMSTTLRIVHNVSLDVTKTLKDFLITGETSKLVHIGSLLQRARLQILRIS